MKQNLTRSPLEVAHPDQEGAALPDPLAVALLVRRRAGLQARGKAVLLVRRRADLQARAKAVLLVRRRAAPPVRAKAVLPKAARAVGLPRVVLAEALAEAVRLADLRKALAVVLPVAEQRRSRC